MARISLWTDVRPLVLASKSAARRELLEAAGVPIVVDPADIDERAIEATMKGADPERVAEALSREKALEVSRRRQGELCLGADQVLSLDGEALHKAASFEEARAKLTRLAGRTHRRRPARRLCRASAPINWRLSGCIFSSGLKVLIRPSSDCRSSRC